ncbi:hypothetical protein BHS62_24690 [Salmonella enterica]|nr:hypothetical protein [Salmonella enterica]EAX6581744.1 hypothetical protein [Salmonella enterica]
MSFIWNEERLTFLCENAGVLSTKQIADILHTNITVVRNMAYRMNLSLRVPGYNEKCFQQVIELYKSSENITLKDIAKITGLTIRTVQYIIYVKSKSRQYAKHEYISFFSNDSIHYFVKKNLIDDNRTCLDESHEDDSFCKIYLKDGSLYYARDIRNEIFISDTQMRYVR